jgi:hypothetical protein
MKKIWPRGSRARIARSGFDKDRLAPHLRGRTLPPPSVADNSRSLAAAVELGVMELRTW